MTQFPEKLVIPDKVVRRQLARHPRDRKLCRDNRPYVAVPFTIPDEVVVGDYAPMWAVDRDYWIAMITAEIGRHDGAHPLDGTPSGSDMQINVRRIKTDLSGDAAILTADSRLRIQEDHHRDSARASEDGALTSSDLAVPRLYRDQAVYVRVVQVGSGRPGHHLVVTLHLVPYPWADRDAEP